MLCIDGSNTICNKYIRIVSVVSRPSLVNWWIYFGLCIPKFFVNVSVTIYLPFRVRNNLTLFLKVIYSAQQPPSGTGPPHSRGFLITLNDTLQSVGLLLISPSQRPLPDNTQYSRQTDIHAPSAIRTHNLSRLATADLRLRPRGHRGRLPCPQTVLF